MKTCVVIFQLTKCIGRMIKSKDFRIQPKVSTIYHSM